MISEGDYFTEILDLKREKREEFFVNLFELCNLRCSFCWQDHSSTIGMNSIVKNANAIIEKIKTKKNEKKSFDVNVMGGELFFDDIPDELFDQYEEFAFKIHKYALSVDIKIHFNWVTNLVFAKTDRLLNFLDRLNHAGLSSIITTSYDPRGRFSTRNRELFEKNLKVFNKYLRSIGVVMTKPNIKAITKGDSFLEKLYLDYDLYFDYYSPEQNYELMLPKESELLDFFKYMFEKYPKAEPFRSWVSNSSNKMTCRSSNIILPDGSAGKCRSLVNQDMYDMFESKIEIEDNNSMEKSFLEQRNCLTCEYFKRCGMGCFLQSDFKRHKDLYDCLFFLTFEHIEDLRSRY